jgi:hypothetical protein
MKLICLTPFRNAARELPGFFRSVAAFCDGVVALDDGSTDNTADLLAANPRVLALLRNPLRESYAGWDDAQNRARLLEAAGSFQPDWLLQLDADERMDRASGMALRKFLPRRACREFAYGLEVCRMIGDEAHFDKTMSVFRVFAWREGLRLPSRRLHLIPIPIGIPRERWFRLNLRIKHLAGLTPARRRRRFEKYQEADPRRQWQASYENLLAKPVKLKRWKRHAGGEVLVSPKRHAELKRRLRSA